jgi:ADP-ribosylglycohydrolase
MIPKAEFIKDKNKIIDKAIGSLCGLAIGDSFGDAARKPDNQINYGFITDFNKGASWSTDDTEFALLTAKILIDCNGNLTSNAVVDAWLEHVATQDELKRGGASEVEASINLRRGLRPPLSGKFNSYFTSDGAAMRISPIGIICAGDPEKAAAMAEIDASISHYQDGIWGAQAVAAAVSVAMVDGTIDEIIDDALSVIPDDSWFYYTFNKALEIGNRAGKSLADAWMPLHDELWSSYRATVAEAVSEAFGVLNIVNNTFKNGVIAAGNFGRDADTIGAIVGAVLGAKYGASQIPEKWIEKTRYPTGTCLLFTKGIDIIETAKKLAELAV